jgi:hypothetical protein
MLFQILEITALLAIGYRLPHYLTISLTPAGAQAVTDARSALPGAIAAARSLGAAAATSARQLGLSAGVAVPESPEVFAVELPAPKAVAAAKSIQRTASKSVSVRKDKPQE